MVLIRKYEEPAARRGAQLAEALVGRQVASLDLLQHHGQHYDVLDRRMLQQIHLPPSQPTPVTTKCYTRFSCMLVYTYLRYTCLTSTWDTCERELSCSKQSQR